MKRNMIRAGVLVLVLIFSVVLFITGKAHVLILDNKAMTIGSSSFDPLPGAVVYVDDLPKIKLAENDRNTATVKGGGHKIKIEVLDSAGNVASTSEKEIELGLGRMYLLSAPAMVKGDAGFVQEMTPQ